MKPVLVLQHMSGDGPAYLATWLREQGRAFEVFNSAAGQVFPASMEDFGALAVLGGEMSVNDDLPPLRRAEALIRESMARDLPVIGHCLGGQLMASALGARVSASPAPEIGWQRATVHDHDEAREWFGDAGEVTVFHWHFEAFELPRGAVALASSPACPHQAFAIGRHLAMQFHVEVDADKLASWSASRDPAFLALQQSCPTVQSGAAMRADATRRLGAQQALASRLYARWLGVGT
jgi:GMP synthase-like glutamine amidotransferase